MVSDRCGYKWLAPLLLEGGGVREVQEECYLKIGHKEDHRSLGGVTAPNYVERREASGR